MRPRASIMLELMAAIAVFTMAGLAVLGVLSDAFARARSVSDAARAGDLARSAMSQLQAGIVLPESLDGPVPEWTPEVDLDGFSDVAPEPSGWMLGVATSPSSFPGLTEVSITAWREDPLDPDRRIAEFTLVQLVSLRAPEEDAIGETDEITERAERAAPPSPSRPEAPARQPNRRRGGNRSGSQGGGR